jgi:hypothetical protein
MNTNHDRNRARRTEQSGFVLIIALLLLVALSLIGAAALRNVSLQEKMAGNFFFRTTIAHEAESALRAARNNALVGLEAQNITWVFDSAPRGWNGDILPEMSVAYWKNPANWENTKTIANANTGIAVDSSLGAARWNVERSDLSRSFDVGANANLTVLYLRASSITVEQGTGATAVVQEWFKQYTD